MQTESDHQAAAKYHALAEISWSPAGVAFALVSGCGRTGVTAAAGRVPGPRRAAELQSAWRFARAERY